MRQSLFFLNKMEMHGTSEGKDGRGRKIDPNSARQKKLAEAKAKKEAGIVVKRGRPSGSGNTKKLDLKELMDGLDIG